MWKPDDTQTREGDAENCRSPRILCRLLLRIRLENEDVFYDASTAVGALILCPLQFPDGARIEVTYIERGVSALFRVIWCGQPEDSFYKAGIQLLVEDLDFWGPAYDPNADEVGSAGRRARTARQAVARARDTIASASGEDDLDGARAHHEPVRQRGLQVDHESHHALW